MKPITVSRRIFIGAMGGAVTALQAAKGPNDQLVIGMIGVGNQGTGRLREFLKHSDVRIGAICDVDRNHLDRALALTEKTSGISHKASAISAASSISRNSTPHCARYAHLFATPC